MKVWAVAALAFAIAATCVVSAADEGVPIGVLVQDVDGTPLPGASVLLQRSRGEDGTGSSDQRKATDQNGKVQFEAVPEGKYVLRVDISGWASTTIGPFTRWNLTTRGSGDQPEKLVVTMNPIQICAGGITVSGDGR